MTGNKKAEIYKSALDFYGKHVQKIIAIEEMSELTKLLSKILRGQEVNEDHVREEIADVINMMGQLRFMFGSKMVDKHIDAKLERLEGRMYEDSQKVR